MANYLYRFIERASYYIGEMLALSYFDEMVNTYNVDLPLDTENKVAYFFPKQIVDDVGGVTDSALIGIANHNGEFDELSGIGVPNGGEIVNVSVGNNTFEAVLFSPIPVGGIVIEFNTNAYNTKQAFYNFISTRVSTLSSISDIINFSVVTNTVRFDVLNNISINASAFSDDTEVLKVSDSSSKIVALGDKSFKNSVVTEVTFSGCTILGQESFMGCASLTSASLIALTEMGAFAFQNCTNLIAISFLNCTQVGEGSFSGCSSVTSFDLPLLTNIPNATFKDCSSCTSFKFNNALTLQDNVFSGCTSATTFTLPSATSCGNSTFEGCTSATTIDIHSLQLAGYRCFYGCEAITSFLFPKLNSAGTECFMGCILCASMDIFSILNLSPIGLVGDYCFTDCEALETITLQFALDVNRNAFEGCLSLTDANLPNAITLGDSAFKNCSALLNVNISNLAATCGSTTGNDGVFLGCVLSDLTIYVNTTILTDLDITDSQFAGANIVV